MARDRDQRTTGPTRFESAEAEIHPTTPMPAPGPSSDAPANGATAGSPGPEPANARRAPRILDARSLLGDDRVLHIEHAGEVYTLRLTRNDRLILTK